GAGARRRVSPTASLEAVIGATRCSSRRCPSSTGREADRGRPPPSSMKTHLSAEPAIATLARTVALATSGGRLVQRGLQPLGRLEIALDLTAHGLQLGAQLRQDHRREQAIVDGLLDVGERLDL